jgi:conjugal transfer pilus assembly protein TraW
MPFDMTLVLIDGDDRDQIEWLAASPLLNDPKIRILATGGSARELTEKFKRPVSYADNRLTIRFRVGAVPAIIQAQGKLIQVEEVKVATH